MVPHRNKLKNVILTDIKTAIKMEDFLTISDEPFDEFKRARDWAYEQIKESCLLYKGGVLDLNSHQISHNS